MGKRKKKKKKKKNDGTFQGKRRGHGRQELDPNSIVFNQNPADIADIEMLDSANFAKGDAKYFNNLHKIVQDETKQKEERQRRIRELRKKKADNIDNSIEELAELDELIAQDQENPANYLASTKRINVPTGQSQGNKRIFDKGLPAIPDTYFEGMKEGVQLGQPQAGSGILNRCNHNPVSSRPSHTCSNAAASHCRKQDVLCLRRGNHDGRTNRQPTDA